VIRRSSSGFTVLELAIAATLFGILAAIAVPNYMSLIRDVRAGQAVADIQAVRAAAYMYFGDHEEWPPEEQGGIVPEALKPYLPKDVLFYKAAYRIDWDNWIVYDDAPGNGNGKEKGKARSKFPNTGVMIGISLVSGDRELLKAARGLLANATLVDISQTRTMLVVAGEDGF
jgi:prepilin-type N-terminal cleavage/methylation domain-containing protein